jgi:hypothetical protein
MDKIKMFPAQYGDTILISINSISEGQIHFLIDCSFGYDESIKPEIKKINKLKRFIITHYDKDHIESAYKFLDENGKSETTNIIEIEQIWHNTFRHIQFDKIPPIDLSDKKNKIEAYISESNSIISNKETDNAISAGQAINVGSKIIENRYLWNKDFNKLAAMIENSNKIQITNDVSIILLSPDKSKLVELKDEFIKTIYKLLGINKIPENGIFDDAYELFVQRREYEQTTNIEKNISAIRDELTLQDVKDLAGEKLYKPDKSEANGSSIAFVLESETKKMLFLADAHSEIIERELKKLYPSSIDTPIIFDAIKVSHHGSQGNSSPALLKLIDSGKYLISTNAKHPQGHKHPDLETIARIVSRPLPRTLKKRKLYFNYKLDHIRAFYNENLQNVLKYEIEVKNEIEI